MRDDAANWDIDVLTKRLLVHNLSVPALVRTVEAAAEKIWENIDDEAYTIHDMRHARNVWMNVGKLSVAYDLSDYEAVLLYVSAMIHDIGMQYRRWGQSPASEGRKVWEVLDGPDPQCMTSEEVRKAHIDMGLALVRAECGGERVWTDPPPMTDGRDASLEFLYRAAQVAFAHSDGRLWEACAAGASEFNSQRVQTAHGGQEYEWRPRLTVGLLRFADELDGNKERVPDVEKLLSSRLDDESRKHWLSCYFVNSVDIRLADKACDVVMNWWVPENADESLVGAIADHLSSMRASKIMSENDVISRMYKSTHSPTWELRVEVSGLADTPQRPRALREDLLEGIRAVLIPAREERDAVAEAEDDELTKELIRWYRANRHTGHFELMSGEHTDTFLHCRRLVSDGDLQGRIVQRFVEMLKDEQVELVVAVGTTAIPIATRVAARLGSKVTFTFNAELGEAGQVRHHRLEALPVVGEIATGSVVVIDDVIAGGKVAGAVVDEIREAGRLSYDRIQHLSIFRLGNREIVLPVEYRHLATVGSVRYWSSATECELCKAGGHFVHESAV